MFLGHPSIRKRVGKKVCWVVVAWTRGEFRGMGGFFFFFFWSSSVTPLLLVVSDREMWFHVDSRW